MVLVLPHLAHAHTLKLSLSTSACSTQSHVWGRVRREGGGWLHNVAPAKHFLTLAVVTTGWGTRDRIAGPLCLVQQEADPAFGLQHALELNSACALSLNSQHEEAVKKFKLLEESGKHMPTGLLFPICTPHRELKSKVARVQ